MLKFKLGCYTMSLQSHWNHAQPLKSACVLLPVPWEVAYATSCLRCIHPLGVMRRHYSQSALPRGNGLNGQVHQGYLACAIGLR